MVITNNKTITEQAEGLKREIWLHTGVRKDDFILRKIAENWVVAKKVEKNDSKVDLSNITIEEMLSEFCSMAAFLEDEVLEKIKEIAELNKKWRKLENEWIAKDQKKQQEIKKLREEIERLENQQAAQIQVEPK